MKIKFTLEYGTPTFCFGEHFIELIFEWRQLFGKWNWQTFHLINIEYENDIMTGGLEWQVIILGIGFRLRFNLETPEDLAKALKDAEKVSKCQHEYVVQSVEKVCLVCECVITEEIKKKLN